jgi:superfamily II DNA or RNA helicase
MTATAMRQLWDWQQEALTAWRSAGDRGIVEAVTGTGKTRIGVQAIRDALDGAGQALVLVPTTALLRQWAAVLSDELAGARIGLLGDGRVASFQQCDVLVSTIQSAARRQPVPAWGGLVVADECHRYGARTFAKALHDDFDQRLGLTATLERPDDGVTDVLLPYFGEVVHSYGFREALADEVIAPFRVALLGVELTTVEREAYEENREKATAARGQLIKRYGLPSEPFGEFLQATTIAAKGAFASPLTRTARRYLGAFHAYREVLATTDRKLELVSELAPLVGDASGTLLFGESVAATERIADDLRTEGVAVEALHSQVPGRRRGELLEQFGDGELEALAAPRVLDEGVDVPEADLAVIVAASQSRRQMIQRLGRVVRRKDDGRPARLLIMYVRGTAEDPATGGHEAFLDVVLDVAEQHRSFEAWEIAELYAFLQAPLLELVEPLPEPVTTGWWDTWSTNVPELGLALDEGDGEIEVTPSSPDPQPGAGAQWWQDAKVGDWSGLQPEPRSAELPEWLELRISRRGTDREVARLTRRFSGGSTPLEPETARRFAELPIVRHVAAHPPEVADALLDLERERILDELEADVAAPVTPTTVRVRPRGDRHVLSEPWVHDLWQA